MLPLYNSVWSVPGKPLTFRHEVVQTKSVEGENWAQSHASQFWKILRQLGLGSQSQTPGSAHMPKLIPMTAVGFFVKSAFFSKVMSRWDGPPKRELSEGQSEQIVQAWWTFCHPSVSKHGKEFKGLTPNQNWNSVFSTAVSESHDIITTISYCCCCSADDDYGDVYQFRSLRSR